MKKDSIRILLTGGGTGGHLFPAVATAQEFRRQFPDAGVLFVGTRRKVDSSSLTVYGFESESIVSYGLKGKNIVNLLKALLVLPLSFFQARRVIKRFRPDIIFGVGGYVTGPVVVAGRSLGIPVVLHEQNSVPGLANRKLAMLADRICISLPDSGGMFPADKVVCTGNPVRQGLLDLASSSAGAVPPVEVEERHNHFRKQTLLIVGGSLGAVAVNGLVMDALQLMHDKYGESGLPFEVIHQTGETDISRVRAFYAERGIEAEVAPFFSDMEAIYSRATLLVARAGATTLAELSVLGKPAIVVPYPFAADNHQAKNAAHYEQAGGLISCRQDALTGAKLSGYIEELLGDQQRLETMSRAMQSLAYPDASRRIVACCLELINKDH